MSGGKKSLTLWKRLRKMQLSTTQIIPLVFAGIILLGTVLLSLPAASRNGTSCGIFPALFTATSATCVTGLTLFDTYTQWSGFGQIVIISLIVGCLCIIVRSRISGRLLQRRDVFLCKCS